MPTNYRIMALGDSITVQSGASNYVTGLYNRLRVHHQRLADFQFVGSVNGEPPLWLEGHAGFKIIDLDVVTYLTNNPADIVLIHAGTNDIASGSANGATTATRMATMLGTIYTNFPTAKVVVSKIIPFNPSGLYAAFAPEVAAYNAALPQVINDRRVAGQNAALVDCYTGFDASHWLYDDLHQSGVGGAFMTERFFYGLLLGGYFPSLPVMGGLSWGVPPHYRDEEAKWKREES